MTIRTNFLKCLAVRAVGNALQPQISVINGRFYTRGRIMRLDELGQTFVTRLVIRP